MILPETTTEETTTEEISEETTLEATAEATEVEATATPEVSPEIAALRFEAVAARAGVDENYSEVIYGLFEKSGQEASKENMASFIADLHKTKPALFGPTPASTSPAPKQATPSTPRPSAPTSHSQRFEALRSAGRNAEAEAFYRLNRRFIHQTAV